MTYSASIDISSLLGGLEDLAKKSPKALAKALNKTAFDARDEVQVEMGRVFDRPTPYVLGGIRVKTATEQDLSASVYIADGVANSLRWQIDGGQRTLKPYEIKLSPTLTAFAVPAVETYLDQYGNLPKGLIDNILADRATKGGRYLIGTPRGGARQPGVYERQADTLVPVMIFVPTATYQPRFKLFETITQSVTRNFKLNLLAALQ